MRHSAASFMRAQGVPIGMISKILGHANEQTTRTIYLHWFEEDYQDAADSMDEFWGKQLGEDQPGEDLAGAS